MSGLKEVWKDIPDYEGFYAISNYGNAKSFWSGKVRRDMLLKKHIGNTGYERVFLYKNGKSKAMSIHRLVLMAFCRMPKNKEVSNHIDGNRLNNNLKNLEWTTISGNTKHAHRMKLINQDGDKNHMSILNNDDVVYVFELLKSGNSYSEILNIFPKVKNKNTVYNINRGKTYRCVTEKLTKNFPIFNFKRL